MVNIETLKIRPGLVTLQRPLCADANSCKRRLVQQAELNFPDQDATAVDQETVPTRRVNLIAIYLVSLRYVSECWTAGDIL